MTERALKFNWLSYSVCLSDLIEMNMNYRDYV